MIKKKLSVIIIGLILAAAAAFTAYIAIDNSRVVLKKYSVASEKLPMSFDGFRIAVVSDFHNGKNGDKTADAVRSANPDIICIVGDLVNMHDKVFTNTEKLVDDLLHIAPVYYVNGNHEQSNMILYNYDKPAVQKVLENTDVRILNNQCTLIERRGQYINLAGYMDNNFDDENTYFRDKAKAELESLKKSFDSSLYTVCMIHRGQYFDTLSETDGYDLYLSGHLHGGLVNLPKIRQKILLEHFGTDKYVKGKYRDNGKTEIISGGLGEEKSIPRVFNTPEVVLVELKTK